MRRLESYISRFIIFCIGLCLFSIHAGAQDSSTLHIVPPNTIYQNDSAIRFDELKQAPEIRERTLPDSTVRRLRKDDAFWYVNTTPERIRQEAQKSPRAWNAAWLGKLFWFLVICAFLVI